MAFLSDVRESDAQAVSTALERLLAKENEYDSLIKLLGSKIQFYESVSKELETVKHKYEAMAGLVNSLRRERDFWKCDTRGKLQRAINFAKLAFEDGKHAQDSLLTISPDDYLADEMFDILSYIGIDKAEFNDYIGYIDV